MEARYEGRMYAPRPRDAFGELLAMSRRVNRFFDAAAPRKSRKEDPDAARAAPYPRSVLLGAIAYHAAPFVPEAVEKLGGFFDGPIARVSDLETLPESYAVSGSKPLFGKVEDGQVEAAEEKLRRAAEG